MADVKKIRCPVQINERLHFEMRNHLATRPRIVVKGSKGPRRVTMDRFLDMVMLPLLQGKAFPRIDKMAREERIPLQQAMGAVYDFAVSADNWRAFKAFMVSRKK